MRSTLLQPLFDAGQLWQGQSVRNAAVYSSGEATLDAQLIGGGWPAHGLLECLTTLPAPALLSLWLPVWRHLSAHGKGLGILNAPHRLSAEGLSQQGIQPALVHVIHCPLDQQAWTLEQLACSGTLASLLCCTEAPYQTKQLRRLQLAAQDTGCQVVLLRHSHTRHHPSPAPTRWVLMREQQRWQIDLFKQAGHPPATVCLPTHPTLTTPCPPALRSVALLQATAVQ